MQLRSPTSRSGARPRLIEKGAMQRCYGDNANCCRDSRHRTHAASHALNLVYTALSNSANAATTARKV